MISKVTEGHKQYARATLSSDIASKNNLNFSSKKTIYTNYVGAGECNFMPITCTQ